MEEAVAEILTRFVIGIFLMFLIKGGVALFDHWIAWWLAAVIGLGLAFGSWVIVFIDWDSAFD